MYIPSNIRPKSLEYYEYYDGLSWRGLVYHDYWVIVIIEAASFCESHHEKYVRFSHLRKISNEALKKLTNNEKTNLGGTFTSIIYNDRYRKFLHIRKVKNGKNIQKETRIYPKISAIQTELTYRKIKNLNSSNERLAKIHKFDMLHRRRSIVEPSIPISDYLTR
jgi:hypothetical protein